MNTIKHYEVRPSKIGWFFRLFVRNIPYLWIAFIIYCIFWMPDEYKYREFGYITKSCTVTKITTSWSTNTKTIAYSGFAYVTKKGETIYVPTGSKDFDIAEDETYIHDKFHNGILVDRIWFLMPGWQIVFFIIVTAILFAIEVNGDHEHFMHNCANCPFYISCSMQHNKSMESMPYLELFRKTFRPYKYRGSIHLK